MKQSVTGKLALLGGTPVADSLAVPTWPPVYEATAKRLAEVYLSGKWSFNGPAEQQFSQDFAHFQDAAYGIFMVNGTVTLECALAALGVGAGDEVIIPANTWLATAMAALYLGAVPVFVDVEPTTLCLDPAKFEAAITPRTRAVIPVHIFGGMADLDAIIAIARKHGIAVIEDCAHGHGGKWNGKGVGSHGDIGSFSFQQSKTLPAGESGICLTSDAALAEKLFRLKHIGYAPGTAQGMAESSPPEGLLCHNYRGNEFQALILQGQLPDLAARIALYNENAAYLEQRIAEAPGVRVQSRGRLAGPQSYYGFVTIYDGEPVADVPMDRIAEAVRAEGLTFFWPHGYGPVYKHMLWNVAPDKFRIAEGGCPVAEVIGTERMADFSHHVLGADKQTIELIGDAIVKVANNAAALRPS
jgi:L-glutamine:2-deoxy-scyllo-inosose/3-amino-2,3-dideoxy-scyllo-inosose aminotransferase